MRVSQPCGCHQVDLDCDGLRLWHQRIELVQTFVIEVDRVTTAKFCLWGRSHMVADKSTAQRPCKNHSYQP